MKVNLNPFRSVVLEWIEGVKQILREKVGLVLYAEERSHGNRKKRFIISPKGCAIEVSCFRINEEGKPFELKFLRRGSVDISMHTKGR